MFLNNLSKDFRDIDCNNETVEKKKKKSWNWDAETVGNEKNNSYKRNNALYCKKIQHVNFARVNNGCYVDERIEAFKPQDCKFFPWKNFSE